MIFQYENMGADKPILKCIWNFFGIVKSPKKIKNNNNNKVSTIDGISKVAMWSNRL
jgi:hypothetical protein